MRRSPAQEPTPCGSPTTLLQTEKARRLSMQRYRRAGQRWFVTFWKREPILSLSMPTARSQSTCSPLTKPALPEVEGEAEPALRAPQVPEVVAAPGVEASTLQQQKRFARCCKTPRRKSSPRRTTARGVASALFPDDSLAPAGYDDGLRTCSPIPGIERIRRLYGDDL